MSLQRPRIPLLILAQALFCWLQTYLILKISFLGRVGIATVHREYKVLRSGWKTFLLLFLIQLVLIIMLEVTLKKFTRKITIIVTSLFLSAAALGLFVTFDDFLHTYTHRLLKERFHLGFYLFWLGWIGTCLFFLIPLVKKQAIPFPQDPNTPNLSTTLEKISDTLPD
jgi:hypothetical protein